MWQELDDVDTQPEIDYPAYSSADFLSDVYMNEQDYKTLVNVLKMKKNIILQGAPGVGKTFTAKRLAYSISGCVSTSSNSSGAKMAVSFSI